MTRKSELFTEHQLKVLLQDRIRIRAYQIWRRKSEEGNVHANDAPANWYQAESEVLAEIAIETDDATQGSAQVSAAS